MGLLDFLKWNASPDSQPSVDLSDLKFVSDDHIRYQNGKEVPANNKDAWRGIRVQSDIHGRDGYTVTMYNLDGNHPVWGNNVQMAPKQMKFASHDSASIVLKGYGADSIGGSFADYGLTLHLENGTVAKVTLHMFDRNVDILYLKASEEKKAMPAQAEDGFEIFKRFVSTWPHMPMDNKVQIALRTDALNNMGVACYRSNNIDIAIEYYEEALGIMPNNDDALNNLRICYSERGQHSKAAEMKRRLEYMQRFG